MIPANGIKIGDRYMVNEVVAFSCEPGYTLQVKRTHTGTIAQTDHQTNIEFVALNRFQIISGIVFLTVSILNTFNMTEGLVKFTFFFCLYF